MQKSVHLVDLGESFPTSIYLQNFVSIRPRTSPVKFAARRGAASAGSEAGRASLSRKTEVLHPPNEAAAGLRGLVPEGNFFSEGANHTERAANASGG